MSDHSDEKETTAAAVADIKDAQLPWTEAEERVMKRKVDLRVSRRLRSFPLSRVAELFRRRRSMRSAPIL